MFVVVRAHRIDRRDQRHGTGKAQKDHEERQLGHPRQHHKKSIDT